MSVDGRGRPSLEVLQGAVDHGLEFVRVFYFAALGEDDARFFRVEPGGIAVVFFRVAGLANFHQKSFYHILLHAAGLPEHALGVNVNVKMAGLDDADGSSFFSGFAFCGSGAPLGNVHLLPPLV
jgi:hypothetical protein